MNMNEEDLNINNDQSTDSSVDNVIDDEASQPSLVDKIYSGDVDFRSLDPSTRKTVLNEAYGRLDEKGKMAWDNNWRDKPFFLGKDRKGNDVAWKNAEEYLDTLQLGPVKRERENHRLMEEIRKRDAEIEKLKSLTKMNLDRNLENDEYAITAEIERAKADFDADALEKAIERKNKLQQSKQEFQQYYQAPQDQKIDAAEVVNQLHPEDSEALLNFRANNAWFGTNSDMSKFAYEEFVTLNKMAPHKSFNEKLNLVKTRTMAAFPSQFPKQVSNFTPTTNNFNNTPLKPASYNKAGEIFNKLPERDKARVRNLVASGKFNSQEAVLKNFGLI